MKWERIFDDLYEKRDGASIDEINDFLNSWNALLSESEVQDILNTHTKLRTPMSFDPQQWRFPQKNLPLSYIDFLHYSNGG